MKTSIYTITQQAYASQLYLQQSGDNAGLHGLSLSYLASQTSPLCSMPEGSSMC